MDIGKIELPAQIKVAPQLHHSLSPSDRTVLLNVCSHFETLLLGDPRPSVPECWHETLHKAFEILRREGKN